MTPPQEPQRWCQHRGIRPILQLSFGDIGLGSGDVGGQNQEKWPYRLFPDSRTCCESLLILIDQ